MNYKFLAIFSIMLLSGGYASALTFDVNATGNNTLTTTSSTWTALRGTPHNNLTITTGTTAPNQTIIIASFDSIVNYTTSAFQARVVMDDNTTLNTYNITQLASVKSSNAFVTNVLNISGTHNFTLQAWSTAGRQATIYRWNMTAQYIEQGSVTSSSSSTLTYATQNLTSNFTMATQNQWYDLPLNLSLTAGTWMINDQLNFYQNNNAAMGIKCMVNTSTQNISAYGYRNELATMNYAQFGYTMIGFITLTGTDTIKTHCNFQSATTLVVLANASDVSNARMINSSIINAIKVN